MEEQEKRLEEFRMEQEALKKRAADRHAEEKCLREEQVKRLQVGGLFFDAHSQCTVVHHNKRQRPKTYSSTTSCVKCATYILREVYICACDQGYHHTVDSTHTPYSVCSYMATPLHAAPISATSRY